MSSLWKDVVYSLRSLRQHPAFALTAVMTLALGIGASTAIFSVVNAVLLRPLPYADADRLVLIWGDMRARDVTDFPFSPPNFLDLKQQATTLEDVASVTPCGGSISVDGGTPERVRSMGVTWNTLSLLGVRVLHGRDFTNGDATPFQPPQPGQGGQGAPQEPQAPPPPNIVI